MFVFPSNLSVLIRLKKRWIYSLCCICMCVYRKSNNNNTWFRIIKASKQKKMWVWGWAISRWYNLCTWKKLMSEIQQHLNCKLSTSSIVCRNFSLWDYPFETSAIFLRFLIPTPLPSAVFCYYPSANLTNFWPLLPKKCRRRKWMVPI